jgi:hypothetical protein
MEFWVKARLSFGRADNGDVSGATYLLEGIIDEPHASCRWHLILGISPTLHVTRLVAMASTVVPFGVTPFLKASL